eukprot:TRINITY_DN15033_c0_g2_i8.p1 TRINITY_DN15033_c0_g2~~TRINITY_DN15033_c0_g2_i8.p1  ORF type:complete len:291 (-),score=39.79 TRINITY_DN15033_c0_g2_i8:3857-4672(-)
MYQSPKLANQNRRLSLPSGHFNNRDNQLNCLAELAQKLKITDEEQWFKISTSQIRMAGGGSLLAKYKYSRRAMLQSLLPHSNWVIWKFCHLPVNFWASKDNQVEFLTWFATEFDIRSPVDWYRVTNTDIIRNHGGGLLKQHGQLCSALNSLFSDQYNWEPWRFIGGVKEDFWSVDNQRLCLQSLEGLLGVNRLEDWYKISGERVIKEIGYGLLHQHNFSMFSLLRTVFPWYDWKPWKFAVVPNHFWEDVSNQRKYLMWVAQELGNRYVCYC